MERQIVLNSIECPDGTILTSHHRHDYAYHKDLNEDTYVTDGGTYYLHRSVNKIPFKDLTVYADDDFELVRVSAERGSRGESGKEDLKWIKLCDMDDDYLKAVLSYGGADWHLELIKKEIKYRKN